jgi:lipopolysaccharide assembly outer membrane protein LptD (OstA)
MVSSFGKLLTTLWLLIIITINTNDLNAVSLYQPSFIMPDTLLQADTVVQPDTTKISDYLHDTIPQVKKKADSTVKAKKEHTTIEAKVERTARDSIVQDIAHKKVYMYGDAVITYEDITIKADYIEVDFNTNSLYATGLPDSTGKIRGVPEFTEDKETFKAKTMTYNFKTKEGIIKNVLTEDDLGFLHGEKVKKMDDNTINVLRGAFTTCNLEENPHFAFNFKKARVIPDDKIVTGPVYMEIEGVPTPLVLPFGYFPSKRGRKSGILMPTYGESQKRGFYLENGGYYWAISDRVDFQITGDIYTRGSWAIKPQLRYKKRYKFGGALNLGYGVNVISTKGAPDYEKTTDFRIRWTFKQDPKARPHSTFSADVNIITSNYIKYNTSSVNDFLSNEFQSSISYQTSWAGKYFLTVSGTHRQNTKTHQITVTLPEFTFTVNRFYPLKRAGGKKRFYEDLSIQYSTNAKNTVQTLDSLFLTEETLTEKMQNGMIHKLPISLPMKVFKYFTWSNSLNITDRMYSQYINRDWINDTIINGNDTIVGYLQTDTIKGFANAFDFSFTSSLTTKVYGMVKIRKGPVRAIRHVLTPSVNFSYVPDFGDEKWGYYDSYIDGNGREIVYSKFTGSLYGSPPGHKSGNVGITLNNNLEMKVRSKKDTITGLKKIKLVDNLTISWSYNLAADSLNMSPLRISGRTKLWKNITLQCASSWDPYDVDSSGRRINKYLWETQKKLLRKENSTLSLSVGLSLGDKDFKKKKKPKEASQDELDEIHQNPHEFVDWDIPWSLRINYNFNYTNRIKYNDFQRLPERTIVQTLGVRGQINITPKWKVTFQSGWDFTHNEISFTSLNLYRDLHCWEMRFSWIPLGPRKSWNFSINIKSSVLQDLKLTRKKDFRDI